MKKIRALAQVVGFVTLGLLALYGLLTLLGRAGPFGLVVRADAETPNTPDEAAAVLGSTIPQTMNYQGFVRNPDGSLATGTYAITARIYGQPTGGTALYATTIPNVTVRDGLFNIVLGDNPVLPSAAFDDAPRYIGIRLNSDPELIPRQRLHAVPWALTASTLVDDASVHKLHIVGGSDASPSGGGYLVTGDITDLNIVMDDNEIMARNNGVTSTLYLQHDGGNLDVGGDITFGGLLDGLDVKTFWAQIVDDCGTHSVEMTDLDTSFCALGRYQICDIQSAGNDDMAQCDINWNRSTNKWVLEAHVDCGSVGEDPDVKCQAFCLTNIKWDPPPP